MNKIKEQPCSFGDLDDTSRLPRTNGDVQVEITNLISLEGCPEVVNGGFVCDHNTMLRSLIGGPSIVHGDYDVYSCGLTSLAGSPDLISGRFRIDYNRNLSSLVGGPKEVIEFYAANNCGLTSLDGLPSKIGEFLSLSTNPLTSLKGINKLKEMSGKIYVNNCPITSHILGVLFIKGCTGIDTDDYGEIHTAANILNSNIRKGRAGLLTCQQALIKAGLADFAQI